MPPSFTLGVTVNECDLDEAGHVNNAVYLTYAEAAARAQAQAVGLDYATLKRLGLLPVVREHRIRYLARVGVGERLEVRTQITAWEGFRTQRQTQIVRGEKSVVEIETEWIWLDNLRFRPKVPPSELLAVFRQ